MTWNYEQAIEKGAGPAEIPGGPKGKKCPPGNAGRAAPSEESHHACAYCGGKGLAKGYKCPVCRGSGEVAVEPPSVACAFCKGSGQSPARSFITCSACRGTGRVHVSPPVKLCKACRGTGRKPGQALYCGECHGAGVASITEPS